jgi:broad specificity phosphatase PhoE
VPESHRLLARDRSPLRIGDRHPPRQPCREATLTTSITFLCAGATASSRAGGFASADEGLDPDGSTKAARIEVARFDHAVAAPSAAALDTATAARFTALPDPRLADIDHGDWSGRSFAEIEASAPDALYAWLADPAIGAPRGETIAMVAARVGAWLDEAAARGGKWLAITHPMTIRAALIHSLAMPAATAFAIDVAPLSTTILSFNRRWRLQELRRA